VTEQLPVFDEIAVDLARLKRREQEAHRHLVFARERAASFPSDFRAREVRKLTDQHEQMVTRIDELEAMLLPLRRVREPSTSP
jgi:hypothetical protein